MKDTNGSSDNTELYVDTDLDFILKKYHPSNPALVIQEVKSPVIMIQESGQQMRQNNSKPHSPSNLPPRSRTGSLCAKLISTSSNRNHAYRIKDSLKTFKALVSEEKLKGQGH